MRWNVGIHNTRLVATTVSEWEWWCDESVFKTSWWHFFELNSIIVTAVTLSSCRLTRLFELMLICRVNQDDRVDVNGRLQKWCLSGGELLRAFAVNVYHESLPWRLRDELWVINRTSFRFNYHKPCRKLENGTQRCERYHFIERKITSDNESNTINLSHQRLLRLLDCNRCGRCSSISKQPSLSSSVHSLDQGAVRCMLFMRCFTLLFYAYFNEARDIDLVFFYPSLRSGQSLHISWDFMPTNDDDDYDAPVVIVRSKRLLSACPIKSPLARLRRRSKIEANVVILKS